MCICANKVRGIRAAEASSPEEAMLIREHNDSNVLVLSKMDYQPAAINQIIEAWLNTPFSNEERHVRRLKQISDYEATHETSTDLITSNNVVSNTDVVTNTDVEPIPVTIQTPTTTTTDANTPGTINS